MDFEVKKSGTKVTAKITPKFPLFSCRRLDNADGKKGADNKPHFHINLWKLFNKKKDGNNG